MGTIFASSRPTLLTWTGLSYTRKATDARGFLLTNGSGCCLNNARNAQDDLGKDNIDIEIVVYGPGIHMLRMEATTATRVTQAIKSGISIVACENTMTAQKINKADMHDAISYVPAGVIQLMKRQQQGWAYIRP